MRTVNCSNIAIEQSVSRTAVGIGRIWRNECFIPRYCVNNVNETWPWDKIVLFVKNQCTMLPEKVSLSVRKRSFNQHCVTERANVAFGNNGSLMEANIVSELLTPRFRTPSEVCDKDFHCSLLTLANIRTLKDALFVNLCDLSMRYF